MLMRWEEGASPRLLLWLDLPAAACCDVSPTQLRLVWGDEEVYVALPCAMQALEARRAKGRLRLTLEEKAVWGAGGWSRGRGRSRGWCLRASPKARATSQRRRKTSATAWLLIVL